MSSVVVLTVLDVIEREGLQHNASEVGDHLTRRLNGLAQRHPLIGAVRGIGLYMGVELVRDQTTLEPADTEPAAICERPRELGVIVQPTGVLSGPLRRSGAPGGCPSTTGGRSRGTAGARPHPGCSAGTASGWRSCGRLCNHRSQNRGYSWGSAAMRGG